MIQIKICSFKISALSQTQTQNSTFPQMKIHIFNVYRTKIFIQISLFFLFIFTIFSLYSYSSVGKDDFVHQRNGPQVDEKSTGKYGISELELESELELDLDARFMNALLAGTVEGEGPNTNANPENMQNYLIESWISILQGQEQDEMIKQGGGQSGIIPIIPKIIYTYWAQGLENVPSLTKRCLISWQKQNPSYTIILLTRSNTPLLLQALNMSLPPLFSSIRAQWQADWIRLAFLKARGGIWMDSSIFALQSLDKLVQDVQNQGKQGFMYYLGDWSWPSVGVEYSENWFILSSRGNPSIKAWFSEFDYCFTVHGMRDSYLSELKEKYGEWAYKNLVQGNPMPSYLKQHMAWQKIVQVDGMPVFAGREATRMESGGPLAVSALVGMREELFVWILMMKPWPLVTMTTTTDKEEIMEKKKGLDGRLEMLKLRNFDRKWIGVYRASVENDGSSCRFFCLGRVWRMVGAAFWNGGDLGWFINHSARVLLYGIFGLGSESRVQSDSVYCLYIEPEWNACR